MIIGNVIADQTTQMSIIEDDHVRILDSQPRMRPFSLEYTQLLTESKNLKGEVVARTEECAEAGEEGDKKWNHEFGFIA